MDEQLARVEAALEEARVAVRRARSYLEHAATAPARDRARRLLAAREATVLGLVAEVLSLRAQRG